MSSGSTPGRASDQTKAPWSTGWGVGSTRGPTSSPPPPRTPPTPTACRSSRPSAGCAAPMPPATTSDVSGKRPPACRARTMSVRKSKTITGDWDGTASPRNSGPPDAPGVPRHRTMLLGEQLAGRGRSSAGCCRQPRAWSTACASTRWTIQMSSSPDTPPSPSPVVDRLRKMTIQLWVYRVALMIIVLAGAVMVWRARTANDDFRDAVAARLAECPDEEEHRAGLVHGGGGAFVG